MMKIRFLGIVAAAMAITACEQQVEFRGEPTTTGVEVIVTAGTREGGVLRPAIELYSQRHAFGQDMRRRSDPAILRIENRNFEGWIRSVGNHGRSAAFFLDDDFDHDDVLSVLGKTGTIDIYPAAL